MRFKRAIAAALAVMAAAPFLANAVARTAEEKSITLYNDEGMQGAPVTITTDVSNLQTVSAAEGFDSTANDYAYSLKAQGRWQVCMDAGFQTDCREVSGEVANLGEQGGSISSVRYLGPVSTAAAPSGKGKPKGKASTGQVAAGPASQPADDWQPMYRVDLFGNDYREIVYDRPGNTWRQCKAACDGDKQCQAWTYVAPGRQPHGECFLKNPVPEASSSECCTSGIKGATSAGNARGDAAINRVVRRLGDRAGGAAERKVSDEVEGAIGRVLDRIF